jgi:glutaredoxin-like YruB-family protein
MNKPVAIYTTPTCGFCKLTKEFLKSKGVAYTEHDVSTDTAKAQEMVEKSGQMGVPVTFVGEGAKAEMIIGFDQAKLSKALGL